MLLATKNQKLQVALSAAKTTNDMPWYMEFLDTIQERKPPGNYHGVTAGMTPVDMLPVPADNTAREVSELYVYNLDTATKDVIIQLVDGATTRILLRVTLIANKSLFYVKPQGWFLTP